MNEFFYCIQSLVCCFMSCATLFQHYLFNNNNHQKKLTVSSVCLCQFLLNVCVPIAHASSSFSLVFNVSLFLSLFLLFSFQFLHHLKAMWYTHIDIVKYSKEDKFILFYLLLHGFRTKTCKSFDILHHCHGSNGKQWPYWIFDNWIASLT